MTSVNEQHIREDFSMTQAEADAVAVISQCPFSREELENLAESKLADIKSRIGIFMSYYGERVTPPLPSRKIDAMIALACVSLDYSEVKAMLPDCVTAIEAMFSRAGFVCERID